MKFVFSSAIFAAGSIEDELKFALGDNVDNQIFDDDIDEAIRSADGDNGSVIAPFAVGLSRSSSQRASAGGDDCDASALGFTPRDPFQLDEGASAGAASDHLGLSRLVTMPGDGGCDGPTYVPLNDAFGGGDNMDPPSVPVQSELDNEPAAAAQQLRQFIFGGDPYAAPKGQRGAPGPTHKYPAAGPPPLPERQRLARSRRRRLRARYQVINKLGGNLREIRRRAVADSKVCSGSPGPTGPGGWTTLASGALGYTTSQPPSPGRDELLRSFASGLDPVSYVAGVCWDSVREVMVAKPVSAPPVSDKTPPGAVVARPARGDKTPAVVSPPSASGAAASPAAPVSMPKPEKDKRRKKRGKGPVARGPSGRKVREVVPTLHGVELPTGTDPESRRKRRLMRNRLTAQASRDRKRAAIEEARRARDEREVEIVALRRTLRNENERLRSLESMLYLAQPSMTQEQFARVTGMSTATGMATVIAAP